MPTRPLHKTPRRFVDGGRRASRTRSSSSRRPPAAAARPRTPRIPRNATIRRQHVRCGKCPRWHGPYWYAFWEVDGRTRSAYIGSDKALARLIDSWGGEPPALEDLDELEADA